MAKENEGTKPEGTGPESDDDESVENPTGQVNTEVDDDEDAADEAEVEAGVSDTVPRSEMVKAIKARQQAKKRLREREQELADLRRQNETDSEKATREAAEKASKAVTDLYKPALIKTGARAALLAAQPKRGADGIPRLIKLMDLDAIDVTEDLELEGVEDEVARLQEEFPELFGEDPAPKGDDEDGDEKKTARRKPATTTTKATSKAQDGSDKKPAPKKLTTAEIIMRKMRGED